MEFNNNLRKVMQLMLRREECKNRINQSRCELDSLGMAVDTDTLDKLNLQIEMDQNEINIINQKIDHINKYSYGV
jgi:hypothetical protein